MNEAISLKFHELHHFAQKNKLALGDDGYFASYDVSLCRDVFASDRLQHIRSILRQDNTLNNHAPLSVQNTIHTLELCLLSTESASKGHVYQQINDFAVGSSIPTIVSKLFIARLKYQVFNNFGSPQRARLSTFTMNQKSTAPIALQFLRTHLIRDIARKYPLIQPSAASFSGGFSSDYEGTVQTSNPLGGYVKALTQSKLYL
ncbi:reverse transcriptase [Clonorchis sinensis]|uniref:Reverse transcriptase n=1 Tax=Clonorchis sinensis TaxID=79923 RepID=G7YPR8_CLOSI|nr:reverse transcriptase [Clonorchis sinensis]